MTKKLILDVDTGTDDAVAIMLAALHDDLELVGCTTVNGNTSVENCTENTLKVLDYIGMPKIPVHQGLTRPIARQDFPEPRKEGDQGSRIHGPKLPLPDTSLKAKSNNAVEYLIETFRNATDEIALVPVGPLSNIAAALALDPDFVKNVPEVVIMGGSHGWGNRTAAAEFNIWADPEAAAMVFGAGFRKVTMVPLDATYQAALCTAHADALEAHGTPAGKAAATFLKHRIASYDSIQPLPTKGYAPIHDALAVAALIAPEVIDTKFLHVDVETVGTLTVGRTVIDTQVRTEAFRRKPANCHVAFGANRDLFFSFLNSAFSPKA
ncbi:nucleoside hydrolase [Martelella sp. HB161492]|uniref:nucleoside hydrolase n=1 Tax=Martelella sp. HB161492 TaxID=2720726 RepID=UPI00158FD1BD|nr:nucleoside hydrolase [Martelella sp. HB161492]